jgi:hypothetical protein
VHLHSVPVALPFAPRPVPGELRTGWLHRVAAANGITFLELLAAWATRLPAGVPAQCGLMTRLRPRCVRSWRRGVDSTQPRSSCGCLAAVSVSPRRRLVVRSERREITFYGLLPNFFSLRVTTRGFAEYRDDRQTLYDGARSRSAL